MSRTQELLQQFRDSQRERANALQAALPGVLRQLDQPKYEQYRTALQDLVRQHIALLDKGIAENLISEKDYRRLMGAHIDEIDLSDLLSALA